MRAALAASCLRGALPPVDLRAVCLVRAMFLSFEVDRGCRDELGQQKTRQDMCMGVEARRRRRPTRGRGSGGCGGGWSSGLGSFIGLRVRGRHSPFGFYGTIGFFSFSGDEVVVFLRAPAPLLLGSSPRFLLRDAFQNLRRETFHFRAQDRVSALTGPTILPVLLPRTRLFCPANTAI